MPDVLVNGGLYIGNVEIKQGSVVKEILFKEKKLNIWKNSSDGTYSFLLPVDLSAKSGREDLKIKLVLNNGREFSGIHAVSIEELDRGRETLSVDPEKVNYTAQVNERLEKEREIISGIVNSNLNFRLWT
ncbi:MAG: hypothetical protein JXA66_04965, partial [Oligoflexia bacterium]|nr:hypothetical protein [Oligoflexia bacterium]